MVYTGKSYNIISIESLWPFASICMPISITSGWHIRFWYSSLENGPNVLLVFEMYNVCAYKKCRRRPYQLLWIGNCKHKGWKDNVCTGHKTVSRVGSSLYWIWLCAHFLFREHESVFYIALDQDVTYVFSKRSPAETLNLSGSTNLGLKLQCFWERQGKAITHWTIFQHVMLIVKMGNLSNDLCNFWNNKDLIEHQLYDWSTANTVWKWLRKPLMKEWIISLWYFVGENKS